MIFDFYRRPMALDQLDHQLDHGHLALVLARLPGLAWLVRRVARAWRDAGRPWADASTVVVHLASFRWLVRDQPALVGRLIRRAARDGRVDVLGWALGNGIKPGRMTCEAAAWSDQLSALRILRRYRCPWGATYRHAPDRICWWAREHRCPGYFCATTGEQSSMSAEIPTRPLPPPPPGGDRLAQLVERTDALWCLDRPAVLEGVYAVVRAVRPRGDECLAWLGCLPEIGRAYAAALVSRMYTDEVIDRSALLDWYADLGEDERQPTQAFVGGLARAAEEARAAEAARRALSEDY